MLPTRYDDIDRYRHYLLELFDGDPQLARCRGAAPAELAEVQRVAGRSLPPLYLGYLTHFGADDGPIRLCDDAQSSAAAVLRYLERSAKREYPVVPPDSVLIGIRALSFARCLWFEGDAEPKIIINDCERVDRVIADSFGTYLYRQTWFHRFFPPTSVGLRGTERSRMPEVAAVLASAGFSPTFFSDAFQFAGEREGTKLTAFNDATGLLLFIAGDDEPETTRAADEVRRALGQVET